MPGTDDYDGQWLDTSKRTTSLIKAGSWTESGGRKALDYMKITEDIKHSYYTGDDGLHPFDGQTNPITKGTAHHRTNGTDQGI